VNFCTTEVAIKRHRCEAFVTIHKSTGGHEDS
jgi:hypothetical protein